MAPILYAHVLNGVRQGAILSPVLIRVYFEILLGRLSSDGMEYHIGPFTRIT